MAIFVLKDTQVTVNSIDLTTYATSIEFVQAVDSVEVTSMSASSTNGHVFQGGLQNNSLTINFNQDFATSKVHATLTALVGTPTTVVIKPTSSAVGASNPNLTLTSTLCSEYRPVTGAVGDLATVGAITFSGGLYTAPVV